MSQRLLWIIRICSLVTLVGLLPTSVLAQATPLPNLGDPVFSRYWARTDYPVADGKAQRGYYFGPGSLLSCQEGYREAPGGQRRVVYLDKARLELNNPGSGVVTSGLLAKELISGKMQFGDAEFRDYPAAQVPVAGDPVDSNAPTYASFANVSSIDPTRNRAQNRVGQIVTDTLNRAGQTGNDGGLSRYGATFAEYRGELGHNVPNVFMDFFTQRGLIAELGGDNTVSFRQDQLIDWVQVMGLPIAEPYWAQVPVGGATKWVLMQPFERRVVTYTPDNPDGFRVEMGNIGNAYKLWRHPDGTCADRAAEPPVDTSVPASRNATLNRLIGPTGTIFRIRITGFTPGEQISFWLTAPSGEVVGTPRPLDAGPHNGTLNDLWITNEAWPAGVWAATYQGDRSSHQAVAYFRVTARPTAPPPAEGTPDGRNATITPKYGWPGTIFNIELRGFTPNERISFWITAPDGRVLGTPRPVDAGEHDGTLRDRIATNEAFGAGVWAITYQGDRSGHQAIVYFRIVT